MKMERFTDKVAIVTGGAQGMGEAISSRFVAEGGRVAVIDINQKKIDEICARLEGKAFGVKCDISKKDQVADAFEKIMNQFGHVDILFNNAGIIGRGAFQDVEIEEYERVFDVNVRGMVLVSQIVARKWIEEKFPGVIVNTGSINSMYGAPNLCSYNTSKGAVLMLSKSMAIDLAPFGIRVNVFGPSATKTPMTVNTVANKAYTEVYFSHLNIKRYAEAEENAAVALFLASDDASYMSGAFVLNDGGISCRQF